MFHYDQNYDSCRNKALKESTDKDILAIYVIT